MAAQSISRASTEFGAFFCKAKAKKGAKQAIVATAHKIARTFYVMLKNRTPYRARSAEQYCERDRQREIARMTKKPEKLGFELVPPAAQLAAS
jgi:uncharacterized protein YbjQ (UPF0145 family)